MIKKPVLLTLTCSLLLSTGCASKNRWFSRKDYSEMQDPFMESEAVASKDDAAQDREPASRDTSGRTRLDGGAAESTASGLTAAGTHPKSIQQTGAADENMVRGRVSSASYPETTPGSAGPKSYQGPALSDFLSRKQAESVTAAAETASAVNQAATGARSVTSPRTSSGALSPAARAAAIPDLTEEAAGFNNFLEGTGKAVTTKSQQVSEKVQQTEESVDDFSSWASQEQQRWSQNGANAAAAVKAAPSAAKQQVKTTAKQIRKVADDAVIDFNSPPAADDSAAQPLMKKYSTTPEMSDEPDFETTEPDRTSASKNPFDNPFDDSEFTPAQVKKPSTAVSPAAGSLSRRSLDESFQMDSGWKPSHLTRE